MRLIFTKFVLYFVVNVFVCFKNIYRILKKKLNQLYYKLDHFVSSSSHLTNEMIIQIYLKK